LSAVKLDALIGGYIRHYNRQEMSFPEASVGTPLPAPDTEVTLRRYCIIMLHSNSR